jgi:hypothetical protein
MTVGIYSTNFYDGTVPELPQSAPRTLLTDRTHRIAPDDPRISDVSWWKPTGPGDNFYGRVQSAWWGFHPEAALPGVDVTVVIGQNFTTYVPDLAERCLEELGDDDLLLIRHPWRDDILEEAEASLASWKWDEQPVVEQAQSYIDAGHPRHWGLFHGGMVVQRDTPAMRAFNAAWWGEYCRWSSQNQVSLPPLLRTSGIKWHTYDPFALGWVSWGPLGVAA